ncbi:hypothetical protein [Pelagirhabdus alkalitolerans]|nr:hypothetical protein [Pelagirhabdus alkalitolerans]
MGCNDEPPIIVQEEMEDEAEEESIELIEETVESDSEEEIQQFIEFTLVDRHITVHIDQIPILSNYLATHDKRDEAIEQMELIDVGGESFDSAFILKFACENGTCSYLLLNTETEESLLLADNAAMSIWETSSDGAKVLMVFERTLAESPWNPNKLMVFDLSDWALLTVEPLDDQQFNFSSFRWPIQEVHWVENNQIELTIPDVENPTIPLLTEWFEDDNQNLSTITLEVD